MSSPRMPEGADPTILDAAFFTLPPSEDRPVTPAEWLAAVTFLGWSFAEKVEWLEARGLEVAEREHDAWDLWWSDPAGPQPPDPAERARRDAKHADRWERAIDRWVAHVTSRAPRSAR